MKRISKTWCLLAAVFVSTNAALTAFAAVDIKLSERVALRVSVVRLGDVAEITTGDRQRARELSSLPLMPAPAPGTERFLRTREIQDMLAAQGVEVGELRFGGAERVAITSADGDEVPTNNKPNRLRPATKNRHAAILAGETSDQPAAPLDETRASKLREQLDRIIANYLSAKTGKVGPWRIQCDAEQRELRRLDAAVSAPVCTGGNEPWIGRQRFTLSFSTSDGPIQIPILAEVSPPPMPAVVAVRAISRGDVIRAADVELRSVDNNSKLAGQRGAFDSVEKLIGMEARQAIREGEVVLTDQVKAPILVKRGETITVTSQSGGIRVRTTARATHDGAQGELVQVEALGSREKYDVKVVGPRQAAVFAVPRLATEPQQRTDTARR